MLTIVWHSRTGAARAMAQAAAEGAGAGGRLIGAADATAQDLMEAQGLLFVCPENLGTMTGQMKEMFDRCYYPVLGLVEGRPYATIVSAGSDGQGAQRQIDRIATGWRLKRVAEPIIIAFHAQTAAAILARKTATSDAIGQCRDLGATMAEGIAMGVL